jgi:hypothetical protein
MKNSINATSEYRLQALMIFLALFAIRLTARSVSMAILYAYADRTTS